MSKRKLTVFIGRFSPFHFGHAAVLERALKLSEKVLVIVGSAKQPRTTKNPWTATERATMISNWYSKYKLSLEGIRYTLNSKDQSLEIGELVLAENRDFMYNNQLWLTETQNIIKQYESDMSKVWLTGADRDSSTFYLKELEAQGIKLDKVTHTDTKISHLLSATSIRDMYFDLSILKSSEFPKFSSLVPTTTFEFMTDFMLRDFGNPNSPYYILVNEFNVNKQRIAANHVGKYETISQTVDACVIQTGHVLLIKRRSAPGKGLWALPGGYLNPQEWMLDGAIRELREETKLKVPEAVLRGSMKFRETFEHPSRSQIGRVITCAFCFKLPDFINKDGKIELPDVRGEDDAEKAKWFPLSEALSMSDQMFDDHHAMVETFVSRLPVGER